MPERVVWIDRALADFHEESIFIVKFSGNVELRERMSRAAFRKFIENSARMLDLADMCDQQDIPHIGEQMG